uniref:Uncharacterized protein n=1 Tax=Tanacetum cinerariifolium TaxID=118510 RepID=A0A6L2NYN5_TANCI|nr:hypothetical protein [Tanacetum cinerariifolium]
MEENHRSLQSSNYLDHKSSDCNNIKLPIQNEKSEVICATCKQCLITDNHDESVLQYVNGMKSRKNNQSANVSKSVNQKKHKENVKKSKKSGSKESLASPGTPRSFLRWLLTGRNFDLCGKIISSSNTESDSDTSVCDNASASNPQEPTNKGFPTSPEAKFMYLSASYLLIDMIVMTSMIELESVFSHLFDELFKWRNQVVSKSFAVTIANASDKRQQQQDSTSSTSTLATTIIFDGNFDL